MSQYNMSPLPDLQTGGTLEEIYENQKTIKNWLFQLNEQLRYNLYNMEVENFTQQTVDQLTSVSGDVEAQLQVLDGKITAAVTAADGRFSELQIDIDGITARVGDAEGNISQLQQTATSITSTVQDMEGNISVLQQTATSLTSAVESAEGDISSLQQTATSLTSRVSDAEDNISSVEQTADKINWLVASGTSASNFTLTSHMASLIAEEVKIQTDSLVISSISYRTNCYVRCDSAGVTIYPGSGDVTLGNPASDITMLGNRVWCGTLYPEGNPNAISGSGNAVFTGQLNANSGLFDDWCYAPSWENGSDEAIKREITALDTEKSKALILGLNPVSYYYKQGQSGAVMTVNAIMPMSRAAVNSVSLVPEEKLHFGFVAQEVQAKLTAAGYTEGNPLVSSRQLTPDGDAVLTLNYTDLIAPLVKVVQDLAARVTILEGTE